MVDIISSCFQFCYKGRERSTCFCFTCEVVPNAYSPVCKAFLSRGCPQQGNVKICFDNILLQIQNAPKHIQTIIFGSLGKQDCHFISVFWDLFT